MSRKTSPARRAAFLQALRETGNQTIAAERAKVSRAWVQLQRSADPQFKADVAAAVAEAKASLSGAAGRAPPSSWGHLDGEELVVKGTGGSGGGKRVQIARARLKQWTPRIEDRFLATLAATCNVKAACAEVGMTAASAYAHRKRWPGFAKRWDAAIEEGFQRLEIALLQNGENLFSSAELPPEAPMVAMTFADAIHLLHMHKHGVLGLGKAPGQSWRPPRSLNDPAIGPSILRKIAIVEAMPDEEDEEGWAALARDEAEYARRRPVHDWDDGDG